MRIEKIQEIEALRDPVERGDAYFKYRKYQEAVDSYLEALLQDTGNVSLNIKLGETYLKLGDYIEAKQTFEEIKRVKPDSVLVRNYLHRINVNKIVEEGDHYKKINDYQNALETYYKAFKIDPQCISALFGAAEVYLEDNKIDKAINIFNRLIKMDSLYQEEYKRVLNRFAIDLGKHKLHDKAIGLYKKAISMDPEDEALYYNLAKVFIRTKKSDEAKELLKKALELDSSFEEAKELLQKIY